MKTILLTGVTGFIGSHLLKSIQEHPVYGLDTIVVLSSVDVKGVKTILHKNYSFTKEDFIEAGMTGIDIIIHAGAFTPKDGKNADNINDATSNIFALQYLMDQLPNVPERFIFFSTLDVYKPSINEKITEATLTEPVSMYGWSKLYGEKMLEAWAKKENVIIQVLRIGHIYGSGEEQYQKIIPLTIRKVLQQQTPVIFTKGDELRSFLHVSDCINSVLASIKLNDYKGPINITSGRALSVKQIVSVIVNEINPAINIDIQGNEAPLRSLVFDNSKMRQFLGDELISFEEGIKEEIRNFKL